MKPNFTIALIGRNEAKTLPKLVSSLSEFKKRGGKIILLDTGSTDDTAKVATDLGCKVYEVGDKFLFTIDAEEAQKINDKFIEPGEETILKEGDKVFDYAAARNYIAELAPTDWVWNPDCDEAFTNFNLEAINKVLSDSNIDRLEYEFIFSHDAYGNPAIRFKHSKMYRKSHMAWAGIVHEVLVHKPGMPALATAYLPEDKVLLEHFQNAATNRSGYLRGLALDCYLHPENDRNSHYFGRELYYYKRYKSAIKELFRHVAMGKWATEAAQSLIFIGDCMKELGEDPVTEYENSFKMEPNRREALIRLAEWYKIHDQFDKIVEVMEKAILIPETNFYHNFHEHYTYIPHQYLYAAYWYLNQKDKSKEHYDIVASYLPLDSKVLHDRRFYYDLPKVSFILPTYNRPEGLARAMNSIKSLNYPQELIETLVIEGEQTMPQKVKMGLEQAQNPWLVYAADDVEFMPDSLIIALQDNQDKDLISFNTSNQMSHSSGGTICEHFIIRKDFISQIGGEIFDTEFHHFGVAFLLWSKSAKVGKVKYVSKAVVRHFHFIHGFQMDKTYERAWNKEDVVKDRLLLKKKLLELAQ